MDKLLIIGAGIGQINIVKQAKAMGVYVAVVSPKGYPAIELADELFECDIFDYDRIVEYAYSNNFTAVTSDQNDLMMPTVAYVAEKLGLPGNTFSQVNSYCDKNNFRKVCLKAGVPVPANIEVHDSNMPNFDVELPWIVKPSDSQSSIGVSKINSTEEYATAVEYALSKSKHHKAILEQFFTGDEIVCEGFVYQGKYYNLFFGDRRYFKGTLIPSQTLFPSELDTNIQKQILGCERAITKEINPYFGIIHSEYLVNTQTGKICIVESAIRGGGVYISSHLVPLATGIDINKILLKCALGQATESDIEDAFAKKNDGASAYVCFTLPEGIVKEINGVEDVLNIQGVVMCDIRNLSKGDKTEKMIAKGMRKGPILVNANNRDELDSIISRIQETIDIKVATPEGELKNTIWS